ncbi:porin family protein [Ekhidna sp.]|uniref:porin family protein n=1 Tax=Ekhidna sp. TaxID=2608089 RepID=UPI003B5C28A0
MEYRKKLFQKAVVIVSIIALIGVSQSALAQDRLSFEFRPGVSLATKDLGDADLKTGFGFEGTFAYRFMPHLSVYAGWGWNKFGSDQEINGTSLDFEETGYTYGLQFIHPIGDSKVDLLIRGGGLANHIEVEQGDDIIADSGHGFGWQLGAGLVIPLADKWNLMPSVRYRSLSRDIEIETATTSVDLNYISAGVGISRTF